MKEKRAFTLVELLIASGIMIIALCGLVLLFNYCYFLSIQAGNITRATAEGYGKLEQIRAHNYLSIVTDFNGDFTLTQLPGTGTTTATYVTGTNSNLIEVAVNVSWSERGNRIANFSITSLIAQR